MIQQESRDRFTPAGFWIRCAALSIDSFRLTMMTIPFLAIPYADSGGIADVRSAAAAHGFDWLIYVIDYITDSLHAISFTSHMKTGWVHLLSALSFPVAAVILSWRFESATYGKKLFGIKIVDAQTGGDLSLKQCIQRFFGYWISLVPFGAGFAWVAFDRRKQGFHDRFANTAVVSLRR